MRFLNSSFDINFHTSCVLKYFLFFVSFKKMPVFRKDPCGIICIFMTYLAVFYADYVVVRWIVIQTLHNSLWGAFHAVVFNSIILLLTFSHLRTVFSDPGIVPLPQSKLDFAELHTGTQKEPTSKDDYTVCARCETYRPPRAHHCRICQRCVRRMDHHCPWVNNCIGQYNQKYFLQFLFYVGILSAYAVILVIFSWIQDCADCHKDKVTTQTRILHSIILVVESGLFGLFVTAIMCDQLQAIFGDETAVEQAKQQGPFRPRKPRLALLTEVCGRGSPIFWVLPCQSPPKDLDLISGYDV